MAILNTQNPILKGLYADPSMIKYNGKYYIYPTSDGFRSWSGTVFHAFSSDDLNIWTDEGIIVDVASAQVPWAIGSAWAPAMFERNGRFYFYFCAKRQDGVSCIGLAVSDSPTGGFTAMKEPVMTMEMCREAGVKMGQTIDPSVYAEGDEVYLVFGNGHAAIAKLTDDLSGIVPGTLKNIDGAHEFCEALDIQKRGGVYHFTWSCNDTRSPDYHVNYGTSDTLYGPITYRYTILSKDASRDILGTGHHCIFKEPDEDVYYIAHHRFGTPSAKYEGENGYNREVCLEKLEFDENGMMKPVVFR
ncbi:MAG: family 43 glycosylhydrolase [Clostridia bacterium]|nr:family 43 glycosylhydrolase [Clostridia bacterium]